MAAGPNELIRSCQATRLTDPQQLFEELAPQVAWQAPLDVSAPSLPSVPDDDRDVLALLDDVPIARSTPSARASASRRGPATPDRERPLGCHPRDASSHASLDSGDEREWGTRVG